MGLPGEARVVDGRTCFGEEDRQIVHGLLVVVEINEVLCADQPRLDQVRVAVLDLGRDDQGVGSHGWVIFGGAEASQEMNRPLAGYFVGELWHGGGLHLGWRRRGRRVGRLALRGCAWIVLGREHSGWLAVLGRGWRHGGIARGGCGGELQRHVSLRGAGWSLSGSGGSWSFVRIAAGRLGFGAEGCCGGYSDGDDE